MNHMLVSSLRLPVASSVPSLKREVSKSRNTNRHWPKCPNKSLLQMEHETQKRGRPARLKALDITTLVQPNATEQTNDSTHRPPVVTNTPKPHQGGVREGRGRNQGGHCHMVTRPPLTPTPTYTRTQRRPSEESELPPLPSGKKAFLWAGGQWGHVGQVMRHFSTPSQQGSRDLLGNQTLMRKSH